MRKVSDWVRTHAGRRSIPLGVKEARAAKSILISGEFSIEEAEFDGNGDKGKVIRSAIYVDCENMLIEFARKEYILVFQM